MNDSPPHFDYEVERKLDAVMTWADNHPHFDTEYVESLIDQFDDRGKLSSSQEDALDNIIEKWHIDA